MDSSVLSSIHFSVLMSVYRNDKPSYVSRAVSSIYTDQTLKPSEIVLVVDGPIEDDLNLLVSEYEKDSVFNVVRLPQNMGLGGALRVGIEKARFDIIVRMDSDDVSLSDRFSKQLSYMLVHPEIDIISGQIEEFIDDEKKIVGKRIVPLSHEEVSGMMKVRCPINHMAVCMRKYAVLSAGNYQDWHYNEDYYLWIRMLLAGVKFANLQDVLVNVRVGKAMYARRGGWQYFRSEEGIQRFMLNNALISFPRYLVNVFIRLFVQVLIPNGLRGWLFRKIFRDS